MFIWITDREIDAEINDDDYGDDGRVSNSGTNDGRTNNKMNYARTSYCTYNCRKNIR